MRNHNELSSLVFIGLLASLGCQGNSSPMMTADQSPNGSGDMSNTSPPDATDPNAPGMVRYSYVCDNKQEKTVELPHVRFGATYDCRFMSDYFRINVQDNRVPVDLRLSVPGYHGPGTYTIIADERHGSGFADCDWPALRLQDGNCQALAGGAISACCQDAAAQAKALSCTITIQQHTLTRVTGIFDCQIQADQDGGKAPYSCNPLSKAQVHGSFDFGPQDCM